MIENEFSQKINQFNELLDINNIIYNTYIKNKENYYHKKNIINILVNYYEKGNEIVKELKNNEDFMETLQQKNDLIEIDFSNKNIIEMEKQKSIISPIKNNIKSEDIEISNLIKNENFNRFNGLNEEE